MSRRATCRPDRGRRLGSRGVRLDAIRGRAASFPPPTRHLARRIQRHTAQPATSDTITRISLSCSSPVHQRRGDTTVPVAPRGNDTPARPACLTGARQTPPHPLRRGVLRTASRTVYSTSSDNVLVHSTVSVPGEARDVWTMLDRHRGRCWYAQRSSRPRKVLPTLRSKRPR